MRGSGRGTVARLVELPGKVSGQGEPGTVRWVNPEHVVSVRPRVTGVPPHVELHVELKLEGMPLFDSWFGTFHSVEGADRRWRAFLDDLTA
jgi:hypothetical protein